MFAQGALLIEQGEPAIAVPSAAIINEAGLDYVMVIEDGRVQRRPVTLGLVATQDRMVEIRSGLAEGEKLLAVRIGSLDPGTPVQLPASGPAGALD
jgi:multidrug efflux pump subunit AcrA (membrane-fusion protein)